MWSVQKSKYVNKIEEIGSYAKLTGIFRMSCAFQFFSLSLCFSKMKEENEQKL